MKKQTYREVTDMTKKQQIKASVITALVVIAIAAVLAVI